MKITFKTSAVVLAMAVLSGLTSCSTMSTTTKGALVGARGRYGSGSRNRSVDRRRQRSCDRGCRRRCRRYWSGRCDRQKNAETAGRTCSYRRSESGGCNRREQSPGYKSDFRFGHTFATGKSELSPAARASLQKFAASVKDNPQTDITVYGHTDNTGSREINEKLSKERALAVSNFLVGNGVSRER